MITKICTRDMSREEWLGERRKSIGGSDAAAVLSLNPYSSPYALWAEKTGKVIPEDISDKEAVRLGNDLEQYVAERFMEATDKKVRRSNYIYHNDDYPFAHANPDRMVVGENAGLECKTTSSYDIGAKLIAGEVPDSWYCQMVHYMMVTGAKRWYLGALVFGRGFYTITVERNEDEIAALAKAEKVFWDGVINNAPPALDGSDATSETIKTIFKDSMPEGNVDLMAVGNHIDVYLALGKQIKELEERQEEHANYIKEFMGENEQGFYGTDVKVNWKNTTRKTFDKAAYEKDNGKLPESYYKASQSRSFRVIRKEKRA